MVTGTELRLKKSISLPSYLTKDDRAENFGEGLAGVFKNGELGWTTSGPHLDVFSLDTRGRIASRTFEHRSNLHPSTITCVTEVFINGTGGPILAVGVKFHQSGGMLCLYSVNGSRILRSIGLADNITCSCFISHKPLKFTGVKSFDGCVVIGTDLGKVYLIDLNLQTSVKVLQDHVLQNDEFGLFPVYNVFANINLNNISTSVKKARRENYHLSVQLQVLQDSGSVLSMIIIPEQLILIIGQDDGRMILYDLRDLQAFHLAFPPTMDSPLVKLCYIEPTDDPRACIYVWALHYNEEFSVAVMHSITFEKKNFNTTGELFYENFQACSVRLTVPLIEPRNRPISCQSITRRFNFEEEEVTSVCVISWEVIQSKKIYIFIFDINQWYKAQMPEIVNKKKLPNYLALYEINDASAMDVWLHPKSLIPFNSIQRLEEHFYPNSLKFDCILLTETHCDQYSWIGEQNHALEYLNSMGSKTIFDPNNTYCLLRNASLFPQFFDDGHQTTNSIFMKRNFILSVALEYDCVSILKECIKLWADGSHLSNDEHHKGVSLSTITDWIKIRKDVILEQCNILCLPLFDHSGRQIDYRSRKQLAHFSKQLKILENLLNVIIINHKSNIPQKIMDNLISENESIKMFYEYQEIIQWLLNTQILPEGISTQYPYHILNEFYEEQRFKFKQTDSSSMKSLFCRYMFIDVFIEQSFNVKELQVHWKSTNGLYPPVSLKEMLKVVLLPNVSREKKFSLILYLFLDLSIALDEERYGNIIEHLVKFPTIFRLNPSVIKRIQAFWKLDHGQYEVALDYLFSPLSGNQPLTSWEQEFLIETLLVQNLQKLALRALLHLNGPSIHPILKIKTFLSNNCISEALRVQRATSDKEILKYLFQYIFNNGKWEFLLDFPLTETESGVLCTFLNSTISNVSISFHIIFLLQRLKYVEAVRLLEKVQKEHLNFPEVENAKLILDVYNFTLPPVIKDISKSYFSFKPGQSQTNLITPFSKRLIQTHVKSATDLHKMAFDSINCCNQLNREPRRIPFLGKHVYERHTNYENTNNLIIPKLITGKESGKRKFQNDIEEYIQPDLNGKPKKKVLLESEYKFNQTITNFKESKKFNFSSIEHLLEKKKSTGGRSAIAISDIFSKICNDETQNPLLTGTSTKLNSVPNKSIDEFYSPETSVNDDYETSKMTAEIWNADLKKKTVENAYEGKSTAVQGVERKTDKIENIEFRVTAEIWNNDTQINVNAIDTKSTDSEKEATNSGKVYRIDGPSKRKALRTRSQTPERYIRRSKTPDVMTPTRKSVRLLEKSLIIPITPIVEENNQYTDINIEDKQLNTTVNIEPTEESKIYTHDVVLSDETMYSVDVRTASILDEVPADGNDNIKFVDNVRRPVLDDDDDQSERNESSGSESDVPYEKKRLFEDSYEEQQTSEDESEFEQDQSMDVDEDIDEEDVLNDENDDCDMEMIDEQSEDENLIIFNEPDDDEQQSDLNYSSSSQNMDESENSESHNSSDNNIINILSSTDNESSIDEKENEVILNSDEKVDEENLNRDKQTTEAYIEIMLEPSENQPTESVKELNTVESVESLPGDIVVSPVVNLDEALILDSSMSQIPNDSNQTTEADIEIMLEPSENQPTESVKELNTVESVESLSGDIIVSPVVNLDEALILILDSSMSQIPNDSNQTTEADIEIMLEPSENQPTESEKELNTVESVESLPGNVVVSPVVNLDEALILDSSMSQIPNDSDLLVGIDVRSLNESMEIGTIEQALNKGFVIDSVADIQSESYALLSDNKTIENDLKVATNTTKMEKITPVSKAKDDQKVVEPTSSPKEDDPFNLEALMDDPVENELTDITSASNIKNNIKKFSPTNLSENVKQHIEVEKLIVDLIVEKPVEDELKYNPNETDVKNALNENIMIVEDQTTEKTTKVQTTTEFPNQSLNQDTIEKKNSTDKLETIITPYSLRKTVSRERSGTPVDLNLTPKRTTRGSSMPKETKSETCFPMRRTRRSFSTENIPPKLSTPQKENVIKNCISMTDDLIKSTPKKRMVSKATAETLSEESLITPRKRRTSVDSNSSQPSSSRSTRSTSNTGTKKALSISPIPEIHSETTTEEIKDSYTSNRRMTRHQLAVMEKIEILTKSPINAFSIQSKTKRGKNKEDSTGNLSDNESVTSNTSKASKTSKSSSKSKLSNTSQDTKRNTRSSRASSAVLLENVRNADKNLKTIEEDSEDEG